MTKFRDGLFGPTVILFAICFVITIALAFTYQTTKPIIEQANIEAAKKAGAGFLPGSENFTPVTGIEFPEGITEATQGESGYQFKSAAKGFAGMVTYIIAINKEGEIAGINMFESQETPGLGTKVGEVSYLEQYYGSVDPDSVEAVSGVTLTTNSLKGAIKLANEAYKMITMGSDYQPSESAAPSAPTLEEAMPGIESFEPITGAKLPDGVIEASKGESGYFFKSGASGYNGTVTYEVGINGSGEIVWLNMLESQETPGLGTRVGEFEYLEKYFGSVDPDSVDAIAGVTVTTDSLKKAIKKAKEAFELVSAAPGFEEVLPGFESFEPITDVELPDGVTEVSKGESGYFFKSGATGYNGTVTYEIGMNADGEIVGIKMLESQETPGLGTKVGEYGYLEKYFGSVNPDDVDAVTGATITTDSLKKSIKKAQEAFELVKEAA